MNGLCCASVSGLSDILTEEFRVEPLDLMIFRIRVCLLAKHANIQMFHGVSFPKSTYKTRIKIEYEQSKIILIKYTKTRTTDSGKKLGIIYKLHEI